MKRLPPKPDLSAIKPHGSSTPRWGGGLVTGDVVDLVLQEKDKAANSILGTGGEGAGQSEGIDQDFVQLARLALGARGQDVALYLRRVARRYRDTNPELSAGLVSLLRQSPARSSILRSAPAAEANPVDTSSRIPLIRQELVPSLSVEPIFDDGLAEALAQLIDERQNVDRLTALHLEPTSTVLLVGPPGVGKTLAARFVARSLALPLFSLDLSAVMSSFLGRTGVNLRHVLDYSRTQPCVLLLDELDAIAKRRDDETEIGELKRLVTVLLQEVDDWGSEGLLLAATNHPDLLDRAVWRRFDMTLNFQLPDQRAIQIALARFLQSESLDATELAVATAAFSGASFSDIERSVMAARRVAALRQEPVGDALLDIARDRVAKLTPRVRADLATRLVVSGRVSQRRANDLTGVSRDTIRKAVRNTRPAVADSR